MKRNIIFTASQLSVIFIAGAINAAPIAEYNGAAGLSASTVGASTPASVFNATTANANLIAGPLMANAPAKTSGTFIVISGKSSGGDTNIQKLDGAGPNAFGSESLSYFEFTPNNGVQAGNVYKATDETSAKNVGAYFSLMLTPVAGEEMNILSVSFRVAQLTSVNTGLRGFALATSLDSLNYSVDLARDGRITGFRDVTGGWESFSIDTSGMSAYQNITDPVELRFYGWTPAGGNGIGFDKISIDGTVQALPEPTTTAMMFVGGFSLLVMMRHRQVLNKAKTQPVA